MPVAVFDIDGVVADVRHRLPHLNRRPKDWAGFFRAAGADPLLDDGAELVATHRAAGDDVVWLTGRPAWLRSTTAEWLASYDLPDAPLIMRPERDFRPAAVMKLDALRELRSRGISIFVDDDPDVVRAATRAGFPARLATWVPHSKTLRDAQERAGRT